MKFSQRRRLEKLRKLERATRRWAAGKYRPTNHIRTNAIAPFIGETVRAERHTTDILDEMLRLQRRRERYAEHK